jgi:hypothetical protein
MTTTTSIIVVHRRLSLWSFMPSKQHVRLGDIGVGDGAGCGFVS